MKSHDNLELVAAFPGKQMFMRGISLDWIKHGWANQTENGCHAVARADKWKGVEQGLKVHGHEVEIKFGM